MAVGVEEDARVAAPERGRAGRGRSSPPPSRPRRARRRPRRASGRCSAGVTPPQPPPSSTQRVLGELSRPQSATPSRRSGRRRRRRRAPAPAPAERLVERLCPREVGDAERDQADALFHADSVTRTDVLCWPVERSTLSVPPCARSSAAAGGSPPRFPGFEPRAEQAALAQAVADALERGEHLLAEAGTGIGKSLAYLIPALDSGQRVVVATATKALQEQLLTKDVPAAAAALGREVDVAVLKGRQNYLCRQEPARARPARGALPHGRGRGRVRAAAGLDRDDARPATAPSSRSSRARRSGPRSRSAPTAAPAGAARSSRRASPSRRARGRGGRARDRQPRALLRRPRAPREDGRRRRRAPEHDAVVFDEAHRLEESAAAWFGGRVSLGGLRQLLRDVERACREAEIALPARALDAHRPARRGAARAGSTRVAAGARLTAADVEAALDPAAALGRRARAARRGACAAAARTSTCSRAARSAPSTTSAPASRSTTRTRVSWAEQGALAWAPVDVSDTPARDPLGARRSSPSSSRRRCEPRFLRGRLGLDEAREVVAAPRPTTTASRRSSTSRARFPEPRSAGYDDRLAEEVVSLCRLSEGRALVLTTSYRRSTTLADRSAPRIPYPVLVQGDAPARAAARALPRRGRLGSRRHADVLAGRRHPGRVALAARDRQAAVRRAGRPARRGALRADRDATGATGSREYALPSAILQLRQGFGRLIRGHADQGVVAILDPRLRTRGYGRRFLEALPPCPARVGRSRRRGRRSSVRGSARQPDTFFSPWPRRIESRHRPSDPSRRRRRTRPKADPRRTQLDLHRPGRR